jgi:CRISPR/Cas system-associated endonuclease Cas1
MHVDSPSRDSLACELMEAIRPHVDTYLIDWIVREPLHREWFLEQRELSIAGSVCDAVV